VDRFRAFNDSTTTEAAIWIRRPAEKTPFGRFLNIKLSVHVARPIAPAPTPRCAWDPRKLWGAKPTRAPVTWSVDLLRTSPFCGGWVDWNACSNALPRIVEAGIPNVGRASGEDLRNEHCHMHGQLLSTPLAPAGGTART